MREVSSRPGPRPLAPMARPKGKAPVLLICNIARPDLTEAAHLRGSSHRLPRRPITFHGSGDKLRRQCLRLSVAVARKGNTATAAPRRPYKYASQFRGIEGCPSAVDAPFSAEGSFRIVHKDLSHPDNFRPVAEIDPSRFAEHKGGCPCDAWSLSLFEKKNQLAKQILRMEETCRLWRKRVGEYGVRLTLSDAHGRRSHATKTGHFSFFEYADVDAKTLVAEHFPLFSS